MSNIEEAASRGGFFANKALSSAAPPTVWRLPRGALLLPVESGQTRPRVKVPRGLRASGSRRGIEGISARVLTERLRTLEGARFVFRHYEQTIPPAVTYGITDRMQDIEKVLAQLEGLSRKWQGEGAIAGSGRGNAARASARGVGE